ncbi:MAG: site-specific integrase [Planctomycetota bacterium]|jgi:hypothetical protein|nr:site-specific integrase [Planctomycetota bacterium]
MSESLSAFGRLPIRSFRPLKQKGDAMSPLRRRFIEDMTLAGLTEKTIKDYVGAVCRVSKFYLKSPDRISAEELRSWLAHLMVDQGRKWNTIKVYTYGLRFF